MAYIPIPFYTIRELAEPTFTAGLSPADNKNINSNVALFMTFNDVPALSIAITRNGGLVYAKAFGLAKRLAEIEPASIWHRFRIASVSKPITATAILRLVEQGRLGLADRVFGAGSRLGMDFGFGSLTPHAQNPGLLATITVQQLLEHTCGGWPNNLIDPMFSEPNLNQEQLITWVLQNRSLNDVPGSVWDYSNFGYCLLGRIIEHVSGQTYANFVQANILGPCGITTMAIAGDSLADRKSDEVTYEGHPFFGPPSISTAKSMYWNTKTSPIGFRFLEWTRMGAG